MEKRGKNNYQEHLKYAKRHCILSLLDYVDLLIKEEKDKDARERLGLVKKRIHNDINNFYQSALNLLILAENGGEIPPLGNNE